MSLIIVETASEQPLTDEILLAADQQIGPCLQARQASWLYSLLSSDRYRLICMLDALDAESVRDAYRRGGFSSSRVWAGNLIQPEGAAPSSQTTQLAVTESTYAALNQDDFDAINAQMQHAYGKHGIEWIRSYLSWDRTRLVCEMNAPSLEAVRAAQSHLTQPCDRIWAAQVLTP